MQEDKPKLQGWCSVEKMQSLQSQLTDSTQLIVEVGVFGGSSLIPLAIKAKEVCPQVHIYGIDPWRNDVCLEGMQDQTNLTWWTETNLQEVYERFLLAVAKYDVEIKVIRDEGEKVVSYFRDNSIDILHLDGNHSLDPTTRLTKLYYPKVKARGMLYLDDEGWTEGGQLTVKPAIDWLIEQGCVRHPSVTGCAILEKTR